jgi:EmrB/QacA subfamily drug resistance transporter
VTRERRNPPEEELYARKWRIWPVAMVGLFMALIDVTIVNITLPELQKELDADVEAVSWVLNAYNITFAVLLVSMGRLADQFGRKRFFMIGLSIFTLGSALCALSPSIGALVGFRVVQAVGAAVLAPIALALTVLIFPPQQRGLGLALLAVVANSAAAVGPPLGGVLVEYASWHWIFAINIPIGIAGLVAAYRVMPETYDLTAAREVDWVGMTLIGGSVFALTYGLVEANSEGWGSTLIVSLLVASGVLAVAFGLSQRYGRSPMLTRGLVRNRQFAGASITFVLFAIGVIGPLFLCVLFMVNLWGYSQLEAALALTAIPALGLVVAPLVGRIADRVPPRAIGVPALLVMAVGLVWLSAFPAEADYLAILPPLAVIGAAMGAAFPAINVGAMGSVSGQELGLGSGIVNMSRQLGFALGVAVLVAVFSGTVGDNVASARTEAARTATAAGYDRERTGALLADAFSDPTQEGSEPFEPRNGVEARARDLAAEAARDSFADAIRVAALAQLVAIPFALAMRRRPADAHAANAAASAG